MDGFNGAVLAYGQTSAGKSWTMEGPSIWDTEAQGVVPRCVDKLFEDIEKAPSTVQFQIIVSYYEIYCEKVRDLLNPMQTNMKVRETKTEGFIVQDVTEVYCTDKNSVLRVVEMGKTNRIAAPTLMNAESSRSHSIFSILVDQQDTASGRHKKGMFHVTCSDAGVAGTSSLLSKFTANRPPLHSLPLSLCFGNNMTHRRTVPGRSGRI
jgi:kinesin family protein 5